MELAHRDFKPSGQSMPRVASDPTEQLESHSEATSVGNGNSVLVVEPSLDELLVVMSRLSSRGFRVTVAETFAQAKPLLNSQPPSILVTALRLGAYNGLHLVLRAKTIRPETAALVTSPVDDIVLRADAEGMGATFIVTPIAEKDLIAAVLQTFFRSNSTTAPIRPPFERRRYDRRAVLEAIDDERRANDRRRILPWMTDGPHSPV